METAISGSRDDIAARLTEIARRNSYETHLDDTWVSVHNPRLRLPGQGWKIHVAARPGTLAETLDRVLPVLLGADCDFKVVRSPEVLRKINSGDLDPGAVGKAVTVYPRQDAVVDIGRALADATTGLAAPRVPSDRRVRRDAPVHYRYAPFVPQYRIDDNGDHELVLIGPDGERMPGAAGPEFRCPPWATDPFRPRTQGNGQAARARRGGATLGGRYRLTSGLVRGARGNVYRAEDLTTGERVVVKEARAYVGENTEGQDLRAHLRNERRVLLALAGLDGVPGLVDHFRHGEDEYLVITEAGTEDLNHHVNDQGVFADGGPRDLGDLASQLVGLLDAVHARGVVVRDLSPKNVVLDGTGRCTLVDFGNSRYDGTQIHGWTPGYSVPDQNTGRPSVPADDHYALGATLYFAATGMHPVCVDEDPFRNRERTLMCFAGRFPRADRGVAGLIPRLLDPDPDVRAAAVADIRAGAHRTGRVTARGPRPSLPAVGPDLLASVVDHTRRECVRFAEAMMEEAPRRSRPPVTQVFKGSSGLGMELLHHEGTRAVAGELARWTARTAPDGGPPALFAGRTGTAVFLATARRLIGEDLPAPAAVGLGPSERDDYLHGLAGIGAGHLLLAELDPDLRPAHHATAAECARRLLAGEVAEGPEPPARPGTGMATAAGFAHGATGVACFLLARHRATGDAEAGAAARERFDRLAAEAAELIGVMRGPSARPMSVSWCQGVGGIAAGLLYAAEAYGDERYLALARDGARACLAVAPQAWVVSQCCGLAGVGELLIDVALATDEEEFWTGAGHVAALILARSGGERDRPVFPDNTLESADGTWGTGTSGVLSFLRRLHERRGTRLWTPWWTPPGAVR
jgi:tRNA A-37 threonylcarbamoyl transferase component Bud32